MSTKHDDPLHQWLLLLFVAGGAVTAGLLRMLAVEGSLLSWMLWLAVGGLGGFLVWPLGSERFVKFRTAKSERLARGMSTRIHIVDEDDWDDFVRSLREG